MRPSDAVAEFQAAWLPHATDSGLSRLIELLDAASPLLIHGAFSRAMPTGCLATHLAWHHPVTEHLNEEAGICWLARVARLNPATSAVITHWDRDGIHDRELRADLLAVCRTEIERRQAAFEEAIETVYACGAA